MGLLGQGAIRVPYRSGDFWGYADTTGRVIVKPAFDKVEAYKGATALVEKEGRKDLINREGESILTSSFESIWSFYAIGYSVKQGSQQGLISYPGEWLLQPEYQNIERFPLDDAIYLKVRKNDKYGLFKLDENFSKAEPTLLAIKYNWINKRSKDDRTVIMAEADGKISEWTLDADHQLTLLRTEPVKPVKEGEPEFVDVTIDEGGVSLNDWNPNARALELGKITGKDGREKLVRIDRPYGPRSKRPEIRDTLSIGFDRVILFPMPFTIKMPALQAANEVKAGKDYTQFNWAILLKDGKVGVMNPLGEMITDWSYEDSWPLLLPVKDQAPWLVLKKGGKWGIIDGKNEVMIPFLYDEIPPTEYYKTRGAVRYYMPEEPILTRMGDKYGLINGKGEVLVPHEMDKIIPLEKGLFLSSSHLLIKEQRYGFYEGLYYFPPVFDRKVDRIMLFDDYPVARMLDEAGKPLGYGDRKGFYYFEN